MILTFCCSVDELFLKPFIYKCTTFTALRDIDIFLELSVHVNNNNNTPKIIGLSANNDSSPPIITRYYSPGDCLWVGVPQAVVLPQYVQHARLTGRCRGDPVLLPQVCTNNCRRFFLVMITIVIVIIISNHSVNHNNHSNSNHNNHE